MSGRSVEKIILPSLELCRTYEQQKKIVAGGPMTGVIGLTLVVEASSPAELDQILVSLPLWSSMRTRVTGLTTFDGRAEVLRTARDQLGTMTTGKPQT